MLPVMKLYVVSVVTGNEYDNLRLRYDDDDALKTDRKLTKNCQFNIAHGTELR